MSTGEAWPGIEAHQRAVRPVGVEPQERQGMIDAVLRENARDERLAYAAFSRLLDEMDVRHENPRCVLRGT